MSATSYVARFNSLGEESAETRLIQAIDAANHESVLKLLESGQLDLNITVSEGTGKVTPLVVAVRSNDLRMVKLLLEHGADPNFTSAGVLITPISYALETASPEMIKTLLEAGVPASGMFGTMKQHSLPVWAVRFDSLVLLQSAIRHGADPSASGAGGWTALSEAIVQSNAAMIDYLADIADPRITIDAVYLTGAAVDSSVVTSIEQRWFPRSNALFLVRQFGTAGVANLEQRLINRARKLGGRSAGRLLDLEARNSESKLLYANGNIGESMQVLEQALNRTRLAGINIKKSQRYIMLVMESLVELHELKVINSLPFEGRNRELANAITAMGGLRQPVHDMLDVFSAVDRGKPGHHLKVWQSKHTVETLRGWNFSRLNQWV
ncbi:MAG: ankyrin repeat domain-containing protein, partial [Pseudomonadota bacterium]